MERVKDKNYNGACTRFLEFTHQCPEETLNTVAHPNTYFEESRRLQKVHLDSAKQYSGALKNVQEPKIEPKMEVPMATASVSIKKEQGED